MSEFRTERDLWYERFRALKEPLWNQLPCHKKADLLNCVDPPCKKYAPHEDRTYICCLNCVEIDSCAQRCEIAKEYRSQFWRENKGGS